MVRVSGVIAAFAFATAASAHHGIVNFDLNKDVRISGVIAEVALVNPHSWLYVDVSDDSGAAVQWKCEMRAATVLRRSGWSPDMFRTGSKVTITGSPDRSEPNTCYMGTILFEDGSSMDRYGQRGRQSNATGVIAQRPLRTPGGDPNIAGDWAAEQRVMTDRRGISGALVPLGVAEKLAPGELPEGARAFPGARGTAESLAPDPIHAAWSRPSPVAVTDAGKRAAQGYDAASTDNPRLRCEPTNILFDWTFDTDVNRIIQEEQTITLQYGFMDLVRTIHMDLDAHPANLEPTLAGHSIGRWQDDVLIVDTIGFAPGVLIPDAGTMASDQLHIVERFSVDPAARALKRSFSAEDPLYFTGQYTGTDTVFVSDLPWEDYQCDDRSPHSTDNQAAVAPPKAPPSPVRPWWKFWGP